MIYRNICKEREREREFLIIIIFKIFNMLLFNFCSVNCYSVHDIDITIILVHFAWFVATTFC